MSKINRPVGRPKKKTELEHFMREHALFQRWRNEVLPKLGGLVKGGATVEEIYKAFASDAAARAVTIALTSLDAGKALGAVAEILDRSGGKSIAREEIEHKYANLKDEELDALLESELKVVGRKK